jgi:iron complex outermembrane receptor protein
MQHKKLLSLSISTALGLTSSLLIPTTVIAQDAEQAEEGEAILEEVLVTGSRIVRTDRFEAGGQVVAIDEAAIDALGTLNVADVLRASPLNAYGSFQERSGSSAGSNATFDLRGLGSSRTLVLLDGARIPGTPNLGADSMNINMLPMAAIQRIDILADGASAVYGADAVSGVVNMVTHKSFDGLEIKLRYGDRDRDDGGDIAASILTGASSNDGNVVFAFEYSKRDAIFDADRHYTAPWERDYNGDGRIDIYDETDGISFYGRTWEIYDPNTGYYELSAAADCPTTGGFRGVMGAANLGEPDGTVCAFAYAGVSANRAELEKVNAYMYSEFEVSDNHTLYARGLFARNRSFGRYAPPAASWPNPPADHAHNPFDMDAMLAAGDITEDAQLWAYYRWTNIGTRDDNTTDTQWDFIGGLKGELGDGITYDVYAQSGRYDSISLGRYYLSYPGLDYVLNNDIDPFSDAGALSMRADTVQDNYTKQHKAFGQLQFDLGDWFDAGNSIMLIGGEYVETSYQNLYDAQSEGGNVGGSSGNSSAGSRDFTALFFEMYMPLTDDMELQVAGRYDDYSDFGSAFSPTLSYTWNALDNLTLRARWGEGFKAPSLATLYGPSTFSAVSAYDPISDTTRQFDTYYYTNPDLEAEESTTWSVGLNWEYFDGHSLDIAYYDVTIENVITVPTTQSLFYADAAGVQWDPEGTRVERRANGNVRQVHSYGTNIGEISVNGIDFQAHSTFDTFMGFWSLNLFWSHQIEFNQPAYYTGANQDTAGFNLQPTDRAQGSIIWDMGDWGADLIVNYLGPHSEQDNINIDTLTLETSSTDLDSWLTFDVAFRWNGGEWGLFKLGANNVTDEDPVLDYQGKYGNGHDNLYDAIGRVYYIEYTKSF